MGSHVGSRDLRIRSGSSRRRRSSRSSRSVRSRSGRGSRCRGSSRTRVIVVADLGVPGFGVDRVHGGRGSEILSGSDLRASRWRGTRAPVVVHGRGSPCRIIITVIVVVIHRASGIGLHGGGHRVTETGNRHGNGNGIGKHRGTTGNGKKRGAAPGRERRGRARHRGNHTEAGEGTTRQQQHGCNTATRRATPGTHGDIISYNTTPRVGNGAEQQEAREQQV